MLTHLYLGPAACRSEVGPSTYLSKYLPVQVLISSRMKALPEVFLILRKYLLILGKSKYVWAALLQWDKYLVTK